ncbi:MAG: tRNA pseudouridine(55) synthase TruB [Eubacteriales bacterium]
MINGIINIYKEQGFTSHDVVAKLRGIVGQRKIGHTGTLDPDATGVLPVCLGKATKLCDMLTDKDKTYEATLLLGVETDTQDTTGTILNESNVQELTEEQVENVIMSFVGDYEQIPPMYSALKVNGKKLYELAREGKVIERKARPVKILSIEITAINLPEVTMTVSCSKGTYIRTLCHDIGQQLQVGGCMKTLKRTKVSCFEIEQALTLSEVQELKNQGTLEECILPIDSVFQHLQRFDLPKELEFLAKNGNPLNVEKYAEIHGWKNKERVRVYDELGEFIGIYWYREENQTLKLEKMFLERE